MLKIDRGLSNVPDTTFSYYNQVYNYRLDEILNGAANDQVPDFYYDLYDNLDRVKTLRMQYKPDQTVLTETQTFEYDAVGRLTSATGTGAAAYDYDYSYHPNGNIQARINQLVYPPLARFYNYDPASGHAVQSISGSMTASYSYDANGNMTGRVDSMGTYTQAFDVENRLVGVTRNGQTTAFAYDADGNRLLTVQPDGVKIYTPFAEYEETVAGGTVTGRSFYYLAGQLIAARVTTSPAYYYAYADHLGNVVAWSYADGSLITGSLARYEPFGGYRTEPAASVNPAISDRGFTGHRQNNTGAYATQDVGLIYMNARYYLPEIGRFISADTIVPNPQSPQSYNRYSYVRNSPLNLKDPTGHRETDGCEVSSCGLGGSSSNYLWQTADRQLVPWDPTQTEPRYDAIVYGASGTIRSGVFGPIGYSMAIGVEVLVNHESGEVTSFLYYSGNANSRSFGASGNGAVYVGGVNNLNGSNYNYRGVARTVSASAAAGPLGLTTGYTYNLNDNPFDPRGVWSEYIGWAPGMGASVGASDANYIPIFTNNLETGESSWDILKYAQEQWQITVDDFRGAWNTLQDWFK